MIYEYENLRPLIKTFRRSPLQLNDFFQSDSEIIKFENSILAITTDTIVDEIDIGIYNDPYEIGYIAVMSSISDLTASGANVLGLLCNVELPNDYDLKNKAPRLFSGIEAACKLNNTHVFGGDTNWSDRLRVGTVGIGAYNGNHPVMRTGICSGDILLASGKFGAGNANAVNRLKMDGKYQKTLPPQKVSHYIPLISKYATGTIDTSDGLFTGLVTLGQLNGIDFKLTTSISELILDDSRKILINAGLPPWFVLAGPVGEYELLFAIPEKKAKQAIKEASETGIKMIEIGRVVDRLEKDCSIHIDSDIINITNMINEVQSCKSDLNRIIKTLSNYEICQ